MTSTARTHWTTRVLRRGALGEAPKEQWRVDAYEQYLAKLRASEYPCFFGQGGETRGEMIYTFIARNELEELVTNMQQFVRLIAAPPYERCSLVAFFEPATSSSGITANLSLVFGRCCSFFTNMMTIRQSADPPITIFGNSRSNIARCSWWEHHYLSAPRAACGISVLASS